MTVSIRLILAVLAGLAVRAEAGEPRFRPHVIDAEATNSACAAIDINGNGRLDVIAGSWWYEAPTWRRHFVRDVEVIRGRFDDYSNLPLDVNGNGRLDLVSGNYRSEKLYWVENPGPAAVRAAGGDRAAAWPVHVIAQPGPMETARLYDVDGDGRLDVLPNGVRFAAWWELVRDGEGTGGGEASFRWVRHELPAELAAHGIGFGDIDGDRRGDVVGPAGWAQAPADPRRERWTFHAEFRLHRDAGLPILVVDVDGDGDNDIVWARGHQTGLYWLEQISPAEQGGGAQRRWVLHAIDTSWSQAHSLLWGDIDNDGRPELIAGKRYMGHDGRDLGEYDPLMICAYRFDPRKRTWSRQVLCESWQIGFGLDPKLVDLDGDGDLDLVCSGRSGLYWLENLLVSKPDSEPPASDLDAASVRVAEGVRVAEPIAARLPAASYDDHANLLVHRNGAGELRPVTSPAEWAVRRAHILAGIVELTGPLPEPSRRVPLDVRVIDEQTTEHYTRRKVSFAAEPGDRVPAYVLIPHRLRRPAPAMLCLHQDKGSMLPSGEIKALGKDEPAGLGGQPTFHYAHELARRGYVCVVPDHPGFGESEYDLLALELQIMQGEDAGEAAGRRRGALLRALRGRGIGEGEAAGGGPGRYGSGLMKAVWNNVRALDLLESLPEVDRDRIGCIGHSLGAQTGLFTAVFDQRIRAVVSSCGFTAFSDDNVMSWSGPRHMPRIALHGPDASKLPFDFHEVLAALAPRPVFVNAPLRDAEFAVTGAKQVAASAAGVYELWKAGDRLTVVHPDSEHDFPDAVRQQCYEWLEAQLR